MVALLHANGDGRPLDTLFSYHLDQSSSGTAPIRYSVRQVLDQEVRKEKALHNLVVRQARSGTSSANLHLDEDADKENQNPAEKAKQANTKDSSVKRDFFGRVINETRPKSAGNATKAKTQGKDQGRIWVSFHEGFSNAVRKPITLAELMDGF